MLGIIRGSTDRWPEPTPEPEEEPSEPYSMPDDVRGPFGEEDDDASTRPDAKP